MRTLLTLAAAGAASLTLVACGGSDYSPAPAPAPAPPPAPATAVPDSAIASSTALVSYLSAQKGDDETTEALTLPAADPATSETDEPLPI